MVSWWESHQCLEWLNSAWENFSPDWKHHYTKYKIFQMFTYDSILLIKKIVNLKKNTHKFSHEPSDRQSSEKALVPYSFQRLHNAGAGAQCKWSVFFSLSVAVVIWNNLKQITIWHMENEHQLIRHAFYINKILISAKKKMGTNVVGFYYWAHWFGKKATTVRNNPFFSCPMLYIFNNTNNQSNEFFFPIFFFFFFSLSFARRKIIYVELFKNFVGMVQFWRFVLFFLFFISSFKIITILLRLANCHKDCIFPASLHSLQFASKVL